MLLANDNNGTFSSSGTPQDSNNFSIRGRWAARAMRESVTCLRGGDGRRATDFRALGLRRHVRLFDGAARRALR